MLPPWLSVPAVKSLVRAGVTMIRIATAIHEEMEAAVHETEVKMSTIGTAIYEEMEEIVHATEVKMETDISSL